MRKFLHPSRDDARPVTQKERLSLLHLINQTTLLADAKDDLMDRAGMIEDGQERLKNLCELSDKLLYEMRLTVPDRQRMALHNVTVDSEMRLVPKMSPSTGMVLVSREDMTELVNAARVKCHDCADTPEEAKRCKLYQLFLDVLPLGRYDGTFLCPYSDSEWRE